MVKSTNFIFKISGLTNNHITCLTSKQKMVHLPFGTHHSGIQSTYVFALLSFNIFCKENPDRSENYMYVPLGSLLKVNSRKLYISVVGSIMGMTVHSINSHHGAAKENKQRMGYSVFGSNLPQDNWLKKCPATSNCHNKIHHF